MSDCFVGRSHKHSRAPSHSSTLWKLHSDTIGFVSAIHPIVGWVQKEYDVALTDLLPDDRRPIVVEPRDVAMYLMSAVGKLSTVIIGEYMERHYTTVLHAIDKTAYRIRYQPKAADKMLSATIKRAKEDIGWPWLVCSDHLGEYLNDLSDSTALKVVWQVRRAT